MGAPMADAVSQGELVREAARLASVVAELRQRVVELERDAEVLRADARRLDLVARNAPDYIIELDAAGIITYMNRPAPGHALADMIGTSVERWMDAAARPAFRAALAEVLATGEPRMYESLGAVSGRAYDNRVSPVAVDGNITAAILITHDVTERRAAEAKLRESEERFRALVSGSFEGLAVSIDGTIVECNDALAAMVGCRREELLGKTPLDLATADGARTALEHIKSGHEGPYELIAVRRDGTTFPCEVLARNIVFQGHPARITGFRDITERKRAEAERRRLEKRMLESQKLENLGVMAGGIAHDFSNLLQVILGNCDLAAGDVAPGSPLAEHLAEIRAAAVRGSELTRQMMAYSGRSAGPLERVDLAALVHEMAGLLAVTAGERGTVRIEIDDRAPWVEGDAGQLRQAVLNLVTNATEALPATGGVVRVVVSRRRADAADLERCAVDGTLEPGEFVCLTVEDNGSGMDAATCARAFDPFFSTKFTGRGLGLASVSGIARSHHGAIDLHTEPRVGTRVTVLLPPASSDLWVATAGLAEKDEPATSGVVLVADDERPILSLLEEILSSMGLEVIVASDGRQAVEAFRRRAAEVSIVLLDVTMPGTGGVSALDEMRALRPELPAILLSGYAEGNVAIGHRNVAFLAKPFDLDALTRTVRRLLERR